jgi:virulence activator alpha
MALRHAVLAALLDSEYSGYQLTCLRGLAFEQEHRDWCLRIAAVLKERQSTHAER